MWRDGGRLARRRRKSLLRLKAAGPVIEATRGLTTDWRSAFQEASLAVPATSPRSDASRESRGRLGAGSIAVFVAASHALLALSEARPTSR